MASSDSQKPFRFLALPAELRCMVYENINVPPKRNTLTRSTAGLISSRAEWPAPSTSESSITFLRPVLATNILSTCRLISSEATLIFARKLEALKVQPTQYIVDWASACALSESTSALSACLGSECCHHIWDEESDSPDERASLVTRAFVSRCQAFFRATQDHHKNIACKIVMTMDQNESQPCVEEFQKHCGTSAIVYKTPMTDHRFAQDKLLTGAAIERIQVVGFRSTVTRNMQRAGLGIEPPTVSLKALGESPFAIHLRNLVERNGQTG